MSIDYLPDEMNYERSAHLWGGTKADAFNAGWRAACEAWHARAQAKAGPERATETPRYWASASQKAYAVIRDEWGVGMHVLGHEPRQSCMEARDFYVQHQTDIDSKDWFIQCTTEAEARRVAGFPDPQPAADWRAACVVTRREYGWDAVSQSGKWWTDGTDWFIESSNGTARGFFAWEHQARAALSACPTPPPDAEVKP